MAKRMKMINLTKRMFAFLLAGAMVFGDLGSMHVSAQEYVDVSEEAETGDQGETLQESSLTEGNGNEIEDSDEKENLEEENGQSGNGERLSDETKQPGDGDEIIPPPRINRGISYRKQGRVHDRG